MKPVDMLKDISKNINANNIVYFKDKNIKKNKNVQKKKNTNNKKPRNYFEKVLYGFKDVKVGKLAHILVRIEYYEDNSESFSFYDFDFSSIKSIVIKDIKNDAYRKIYKKEVYSYYIEDNFLYLNLKTSEKLKIRCFN